MKSRDKIKKDAVKHKSQAMMGCYKKVRNKVNSLNVLLKREYFTKRINEHKGNIKETWKTANELLNKRKKFTNITSLKDGNIEIQEKKEIPNVMNSYFCSVDDELANKVNETPNPLLKGDYTVNVSNLSFHFYEINDLHVRDVTNNIKASKGFGNDNISSYFLKLALPYINNSLVYMFNKSIEKSKFPTHWKMARVTPIFKEGKKSSKVNYRPISVLPVVSRIFEKLVYNQLYEYFNTNSLLSSSQSGFRAMHSTTTALLKCTDDWYSGLDLGKYVGVVYVDLKKAFDTVDHEILLHKLAHYGIQSQELLWFKSYLSGRSQFTRVNGIDSTIKNIKVGVPQGSCLGPLLFLIYINDLPKVVNNASVFMYADDTRLSCMNDNLFRLNEALNTDLKSLDKRLKGNKLSLNVAKTKSMVISTKPKHAALKHQEDQLCLSIHNNPLQVVQGTKHLGIYIDNTLDWKNHIQEITKKISRSLGLLKYAKRFLPLESLKDIYTSIIDPHFRYCCAVWGVCGLTEIQKLQKLQNRAARIITDSNYDAPSKPLIETLGWMTIEKVIQRETLVMVFKSVNGFSPQYLSELFVTSSTNACYNLRHTTTDLRLPKKLSSNGQKSFSFRGAALWDSLPSESKQASNLLTFKKSIL